MKDEKVATEDSLNNSLNSAQKHYSSMFSLPSYKKTLSAIAVVCVIAISFSTFALFRSIHGLAGDLFLGISLFTLTIVADLVVSRVILKDDPIYTLRRTLAVSLICLLIWFVFIALGVVLGFEFGWLLWVKLCLLGFAAVVTLRGVVFFATSSAAAWRKLTSVLLNPLLCIVAFLVFWAGISSAAIIQVLPFVVVTPIVCCAAFFLFLSSLDRLGKKDYSMSSLTLFRAFMLNWAAGLNAPLEALLEKMGRDADVDVTLLKFDSSKPKAAVIVPLVHPGPFKNVGSSLLPSILKHDFEVEFRCDACVPLGILGHELDLASQAQNNKIVSQVIVSAKFQASSDLASPFVRVTEGAATVSCQIFGDRAFLSFTLAPKTTEDLPQELGHIVSAEAGKYGLKHAVLVNAHNSITDVVDTEEYLGALQMAAFKCLEKAVTLPTAQFMVGAATLFPKEFSLKDGMGAGGITALVIQVEKQRTAYVVIDGNNMVSGLREKILGALTSVGFDESEVFTTDTHAITATITGRRGYHPVGEAMNQEVLIRYICEVAKKAEANMETCRAGSLSFVVPQVRVIGEDKLKSISVLVDKAIQKAKQMLVPVFGLEGLFLILLLIIF